LASGLPPHPLLDGDDILTSIRLEPGSGKRIIDRFERLGLRVRYNLANRLVEAWLPVSLISELSATPGVWRVELPTQVIPTKPPA
jgi:hypothetical protein